MKTYIVSAFWAFLFACGVSAFAYENNVWVATDDRIALIAPDGAVISSVTSVFGRGFAYGIGFRIMDVDQSDGTLWVADVNNNRMFRLSRTGVPEIEIPLFSPLGISVDSRDGSVWTSVLVTPSNTVDVVKFDRNGQELVRISGFSGFISGISLDEVSGSIWVSDRFNDQVVRLFGSDQELNGYDASGPSGSHHLRIGGFTEPMFISVNPNDDSQGAGNAWVANRFPGEVVKLSPTGTELVRKAPSLGCEVRLVEANPLDGSVWALSRVCSDAITHFSSAGDELISIPINDSVTFAHDPSHKIVWVGSGFDAEAQVIKLNFSGTELFRFNESDTVRDIAIQTQADPCAGPPPAGAIVGTNGPNILNGTPGNDTIFGLGGNDVINGGTGNDLICAGPGNDIANGGTGNDTINTGPGSDLITGGAGDDVLDAQDGVNGNDSVNGGAHVSGDTCTADPGDAVSNCNP